LLPSETTLPENLGIESIRLTDRSSRKSPYLRNKQQRSQGFFYARLPILEAACIERSGVRAFFIHDNFILAYENAPGLAGRYAG
jgi:hypothetical protein